MPNRIISTCDRVWRAPMLEAARLAALWALPLVASALSLGELQLNSSLGQPLDARIRIDASPEEPLFRACIYASLHAGDIEGPRRKIGIGFIGDKQGGGWVSLHSVESVNEPLMSVRLLVHCQDDVRVSHSYTLLLDPPDAAPQGDFTVQPAMVQPSQADQTHEVANAGIAGVKIAKDQTRAAVRKPHKHRAPSESNPATPTSPAPVSARNTPAEPSGKLVLSSSRIKGSSADDNLKARESALNDELAEQTARLNDANDKIDKLERQMSLLTVELTRRERDAAIANKARAAEMQLAETESRQHNLELFGLLGLLVVLTAGFLYAITRGKSVTLQEIDLLAASPNPGRQSTPLQDATLATATKPRPDVDASLERVPVPPPSETDMDVHFLNNVASEAAMLAAHGQYEQAVKLLQTDIASNPTKVVNWIQLLELCHEHHAVDTFLRCATDFRRRFASQALWEKVSRMGKELDPQNAIFDALPDTHWTALASQATETVGDGGVALRNAQAGGQIAAARDEGPLIFENPVSVSHPDPASALQAPLFELPGHGPKHDATHLIDVPPLSSQDPAVASLEYARALIEGGQREEGAVQLQRIMVHGAINERLAAADLLLRLTLPR